jgi:hypothetical protein
VLGAEYCVLGKNNLEGKECWVLSTVCWGKIIWRKKECCALRKIKIFSLMICGISVIVIRNRLVFNAAFLHSNTSPGSRHHLPRTKTLSLFSRLNNCFTFVAYA